MASPQPDQLMVTPAPSRPLMLTPGSRVLNISARSSALQTPLSDETIWRRLRDAGFDAESIKRRDKAALIAYIAKLEAEMYELHHNMGLLIMEKDEWISKFQDVKLSIEASSRHDKRDQTSLSSALADAKKREENLKKALGIEKECVANLEKALHDIRLECAEVKVAAETKMNEAHCLFENAQKKFAEAEAKLRSVESLQAEANRFHRAAERKLREVESREDDMRRRITSFKSDCDEREKEIMQERESLSERKKVLSEAQERLLDGQSLLNQREAAMLCKSQELDRRQKDLESQQDSVDVERRVLSEEKFKLELEAAALNQKEKAIADKEASLNLKEQELLASLEKRASKEQDHVLKLLAQHENSFNAKKAEFEEEMERKRKLVEEELEGKRRAWELTEMDIKQREELISEREQELEVQCRRSAERARDLEERLSSVEEKENQLNMEKEEFGSLKSTMLKEQEEFERLKDEIQGSLQALEEKKRDINNAESNFMVMKSETSELLILETKLKEEIDLIRTQKLELEAEADKLKGEKAKFEAEWELIDEKREELQKEADRIAAERLSMAKFLKDERDSLNLEKSAIRDQYKRDLDALCRDREAFLGDLQRDRAKLFGEIEKEHSDFLREMNMQKKELEDCVARKREEMERHLREKETAFEEERKKELQRISSMKETLTKEQEHVALETKRLAADRLQISLDCERRDREWAELNCLIEELKKQREKLKNQRELLQADRELIISQIEQLEKLETLKLPSEEIVISDIHEFSPLSNGRGISSMQIGTDQKANNVNGVFSTNNKLGSANASSPGPSSISWVKRCASLLFKNPPDESPVRPVERCSPSVQMGGDHLNLGITSSDPRSTLDTNEQPRGSVIEEPKVIREVPSVSDAAKQMHDCTDDQLEKDATENTTKTSSRAMTRKRKVETSSVIGGESGVADKATGSSKKRRQKDNDSTEVPPDISHRMDSSDPNSTAELGVIYSKKTHSLEVELNFDVGDGESNEAHKLSGKEVGLVSCVLSEQKVTEEVAVAHNQDTTDNEVLALATDKTEGKDDVESSVSQPKDRVKRTKAAGKKGKSKQKS